MDYETVIINSQPYFVYADVEDGDLYMAAAIQGTDWLAATADTKARALVTATRLMDRQNWLGKQVDPAQSLQWPRSNTGIANYDGTSIPLPLQYACIELALMLIDGSDVQNNQSMAERNRSIRAGSVEIVNFRTPGTEVNTRFPQIVQELLGPYLASIFSPGAKVTGTDRETQFHRHDFGFNKGL